MHVDHGFTGTNRTRPGLREALAACRAGAHEGIKLYRRTGFTVGNAHNAAEPDPGLPFPRMSTGNSNYPYPLYRAW